jgi:hypothetical protein
VRWRFRLWGEREGLEKDGVRGGRWIVRCEEKIE